MDDDSTFPDWHAPRLHKAEPEDKMREPTAKLIFNIRLDARQICHPCSLLRLLRKTLTACPEHDIIHRQLLGSMGVLVCAEFALFPPRIMQWYPVTKANLACGDFLCCHNATASNDCHPIRVVDMLCSRTYEEVRPLALDLA
ncbi:uncharacterized protein PG986_002762 [Apiospora aurea]|uniref:Uncharacterized protein n=1 Tax=Apiospora aurea TaxID=335848 RepID=A0ABR1QPR3_9PEZI